MRHTLRFLALLGSVGGALVLLLRAIANYPEVTAGVLITGAVGILVLALWWMTE